MTVERDVRDLCAPCILRPDIRPRLPRYLLNLVVDLEEQRLVEAVFGICARVYAVSDDGVAPGAAAELVAHVLHRWLEEVDTWGGADAVHDCPAGPYWALRESGLEFFDDRDEEGIVGRRVRRTGRCDWDVVGNVECGEPSGSGMVDKCFLSSLMVCSNSDGWILMVAPVERKRVICHCWRWDKLCHLPWTAARIELVLFDFIQITSHNSVTEFCHIVAMCGGIVEIREPPISMSLFDRAYWLNVIISTAIS